MTSKKYERHKHSVRAYARYRQEAGDSFKVLFSILTAYDTYGRKTIFREFLSSIRETPKHRQHDE